MGDSLQMAKSRADFARWTPRTNGHRPPKAPEAEQKIAELTQRLEALEATLSQLSTAFRTFVKLWHAPAPKPQPALSEHTPKRPTLSQITATVAREYGFAEPELLSLRRDYRIVMCRHMAMYLCLRLTLHSLPAVGRHFSRDHTSVLHARDKIAEQRKTDENLRAQLMAFETRLFPEGDAR